MELITISDIKYLNDNILQIDFELPKSKTAKELAIFLNDDLSQLDACQTLHGKRVRLFGRLTSGMAAILGHKLAHICKSVEIYDPKENEFYPVVEH